MEKKVNGFIIKHLTFCMAKYNSIYPINNTLSELHVYWVRAYFLVCEGSAAAQVEIRDDQSCTDN